MRRRKCEELGWLVKTTFDLILPSPLLQYIAALFNSAGCKSNKAAGRGVVCAS